MTRMQAGLVALLVALAWAEPAVARKAQVPAMESVLTARLDGWIIIDTDGSVADAGIETDIPAELRENVNRAIRRWRFHPVVIDGELRRAKSRMRLTLAAHQEGEGYRIKVDNVLFPNPGSSSVSGVAETRSAIITRRHLVTPQYPRDLQFSRGVEGRVLLAIRVGTDGRAEEVIVQQSALYDVFGRDRDLRDVVRLLEGSALQAAVKWQFNVELKTDTPDPSAMTVMIPVVYQLWDSGKSTGKAGNPAAPALWRTEVRTASQSIPWAEVKAGQRLAGVSDLLDGEMFSGETWLQLTEGGAGDSVM